MPTWNYVAVHLRGTLTCLPDTAMRDMLDRQSADVEERLCPKTPWTPAKMTPEVRDRMMRRILPFRLRVSGFESTFKRGQNTPADVRERAADALADAGLRPNAGQMTALMRAMGAD